MIIVDLNQVMLSNLLMQLGNHTNAQIEENMVRHMILNSLRSYRTKFFAEYGELIIACDNTNYWRRQLFPYYKANRKKNQEKSDLDWKSVFECMNKIRAELKEFFPYKVIDIESAEADDVIATLVFSSALNLNPDENKVLILSGDKDFIQLQIYDNVKQYDPTRKKWITHSDPYSYKKEHILKGDSSDGVPNILSSDNCFVVGERQRPLTTKKLDHYLKIKPTEMETNIARNYFRNEQLIDLDHVPEDIRVKVMESFYEQKKDRSKLMNYFIANKLRNLTSMIGDF